MPFRYRMIFMRRMPFKRRRNTKGLITFLVLFLLLVFFLTYLNSALRPQVTERIKIMMSDMMNRAVHQEVLRCLSEEGISYESLVELQKKTDGSIEALRADTVSINALKARLSLGIGEKLRNLKSETLYIPLGNLTSWQILSGVGPRIPVRIEPMGRTTVDFKSDFTSAGINQTRHQILLKAKCKIAVLLPLFSASTEYETDIPVAETILVGDVPSAYFGF